MARLIFVDCEAPMYAASPASGHMTEFGAVDQRTRKWFHGHDDSKETFIEFASWIMKVCDAEKPQFVSDNPAYDWQWINYGFDRHGIKNPFGFSARRIGDFYAGLMGDWRNANAWKKYRETRHDHNPVHDAMGNVEAWEAIALRGKR